MHDENEMVDVNDHQPAAGLPNSIVIVKNIETLDEYQLKTWIEPDYMPKID
jgi:hypothetical protein